MDYDNERNARPIRGVGEHGTITRGRDVIRGGVGHHEPVRDGFQSIIREYAELPPELSHPAVAADDRDPEPEPEPERGRRSNTRGRGWCFTVNYINESFVPKIEDINTRLPAAGCRYICFQLEIAPTTGTRHHQGYVYFDTKQSFTKLSSIIDRIFGCHASVRMAKGSATQNRTYCSKPESAVPNTFFEHGQCPTQGARTDLAELAELITSGESIEHVASLNRAEFIRYHGGIKAFHLLTNSRPRDMRVDPIVHWWFGPTGVGKSRLAFERFGSEAYVKMNDKWWDGYTGQGTVIIDDYRPTLCPFNEILRILDRYPFRVQPKGGSIELSATVFVITTTSRPEVLWRSRTEEALDQLLRRITDIVEFTSSGQRVLKSLTLPYQMMTKEEVECQYGPPSCAPTFNR